MTQQQIKHRRRGRPVKNKLADPIDDTPENVMRALLQAKPNATEYWHKVKPVKKKGR